MVCVGDPDPLRRSTLLVAEFREELRAAIPVVVQCLQDPENEIRSAAIEGLSAFAKHGSCW